MGRKPLPKINEKIYNWIGFFISREGYSPSYREIAIGVGRCVSNVHRRVVELEAEGLIERLPGIPRSITLPLLEKAPEQECPYCGKPL